MGLFEKPEPVDQFAERETWSLLTDPDSLHHFVTLFSGERIVGLPVAQIAEIRLWSTARELPQAALPSRGLTAWKGQLVEVLDLSALLRHGNATTSETSLVAVLLVAGQVFGLLADGISGLVALKGDDLIPCHPDKAPIVATARDDRRMIDILDLGWLARHHVHHVLPVNEDPVRDGDTQDGK